MSSTLIRDSHGNNLGYLITHSNGNKMLKDAHGKILGYYYKDMNITKDANGRLIARGDLLQTLLR